MPKVEQNPKGLSQLYSALCLLSLSEAKMVSRYLQLGRHNRNTRARASRFIVYHHIKCAAVFCLFVVPCSTPIQVVVEYVASSVGPDTNAEESNRLSIGGSK